MIDPANVPSVDADELVARFIMQRSHFRSDQTVKPDAFFPPHNLKLSVTRHRSATESEIWTIAQSVATKRQRTLYGRADVGVSAFLRHRLSVDSAPEQDNPNHANVLGWPAEKAAQKNLAQEIAAEAGFKPAATGGAS
jgi:hypothetical protein